MPLIPTFLLLNLLQKALEVLMTHYHHHKPPSRRSAKREMLVVRARK
jgi:hypothetical protein